MSHDKYKNVGTIEDRTIEECAELIFALTKVKRFGWAEFNPEFPYVSNLARVQTEIADVEAVIIELKEKLANPQDTEFMAK